MAERVRPDVSVQLENGSVEVPGSQPPPSGSSGQGRGVDEQQRGARPGQHPTGEPEDRGPPIACGVRFGAARGFLRARPRVRPRLARVRRSRVRGSCSPDVHGVARVEDPVDEGCDP